jgi:O-antigen/teichoic acid export membrane protein
VDLNKLPEPMTNSTAPSTRHLLPSALRNVLANWGGFVCSAIISFFLSPFVVHHLGNSAYGIWILVSSLTGYLGLLNLGVRAAVTRYVAQYYAESKDQEASAVTSSALAIFLIAGIIAVLTSGIIALLIVPLFHVPVGFQFAARIVLILAGLNVGTALVSGVFGGVLAALHRFDLLNFVDVGNAVLSALTIVLVLSAGKGLIALALVNLLYAIAVGVANALAVKRIYPGLSIRFSKCDIDHLKLIFSFSIYSFLLQLSFNFIFYSDSIVIGAVLSVSMITFFAIAGNLINYSRMLISGISTTMTPRAGALEATGRTHEVQQLLLKATRLATLVILPIALTFLLRGTSFIRLWMGPEYAQQSGHVLWILSLYLIFYAGDQVSTSIMLGISKHRGVVLMVCIVGILNLGLSILLARRMGIAGVAWGTTLPSLAASLFFWPWYLRRYLNLRILDFVVSAWVRPFSAVIPFGLLTYWIERTHPAGNLFTFFLQVGLILPTVLLTAWYSCLKSGDRRAYLENMVIPAFRSLGFR